MCMHVRHINLSTFRFCQPWVMSVHCIPREGVFRILSVFVKMAEVLKEGGSGGERVTFLFAKTFLYF